MLVPAARKADVVRKMVRSELATSRNIKSKQTKTAVEGALRQILTHLPEQLPPQGLAVYASEDRLVMIVPEMPLKTGDYLCAKQFLVDGVRALFREKRSKIWGWLWWSGKDAAYQDTSMQRPITLKREGGGNKRHNKGGQSANRFRHRFDNADAAWERAVGEWVQTLVMPETFGVFVGGSNLRADSEVVRKCRGNAGVVRVCPAETPCGFAKQVKEVWIPAEEQAWARDQAALCWDLLRRHPDKTRVGPAECAECFDLLKRVWVEPKHLDTFRGHPGVVEMPKGSLAKVGEAFGELHYAM